MSFTGSTFRPPQFGYQLSADIFFSRKFVLNRDQFHLSSSSRPFLSGDNNKFIYHVIRCCVGKGLWNFYCLLKRLPCHSSHQPSSSLSTENEPRATPKRCRGCSNLTRRNLGINFLFSAVKLWTFGDLVISRLRVELLLLIWWLYGPTFD